MTTLSTLYKKTSTGAIQYWTIQVYPGVSTEALIVTSYGQVGTPNPQETTDIIYEGKNLGKKNETTPYQQAVLEAAAKHEKQRKKGYVTTIEDADAGNLDAIVQGGISPMLAHKFSEQAKKIVWPAFAQPKLDGMRCIAIVNKDGASLWSRERNPILSAPHLVEELERVFGRGPGELIFDGELYNHDMKANFNEFMSIVKQRDRVHPDHEKIQYWVYDLANTGCDWDWRLTALNDIFMNNRHAMKFMREVPSIAIEERDVTYWLSHFRKLGYEGVMIRNAKGGYLNKRSYDLQKIKEFDDGEFAIIGITEGRGRLLGHVGAFVCKMPDSDQTFEAKMAGLTEELKSYWEDHSLWMGKMLTVRYQGLTDTNGVPRFPVGVTFRDYE
jgi:DNA ligase 1